MMLPSPITATGYAPGFSPDLPIDPVCREKKSNESARGNFREIVCKVIQQNRREVEIQGCLHEAMIESQKWMKDFLKTFDPTAVKLYTLGELYLKDITRCGEEEIEDIKRVFKSGWGENALACWEDSAASFSKEIPAGWSFHSGGRKRSLNLRNLNYPGYIYKFCLSVPGMGNPAAHFLRVPKLEELDRIISNEGLDELETAEESVIPLKSMNEIRQMRETTHCYHFVIKSKTIDLMNEEDTIALLASYPHRKQIKIAHQLARLICRSGLGDVQFANIGINKESNKLVCVDGEPLYSSLLLDINYENESDREDLQDQIGFLRRKYVGANAVTVNTALDNLLEAGKPLPIFEKIFMFYRDFYVSRVDVALREPTHRRKG